MESERSGMLYQSIYVVQKSKLTVKKFHIYPAGKEVQGKLHYHPAEKKWNNFPASSCAERFLKVLQVNKCCSFLNHKFKWLYKRHFIKKYCFNVKNKPINVIAPSFLAFRVSFLQVVPRLGLKIKRWNIILHKKKLGEKTSMILFSTFERIVIGHQ